MSPNTVREKRKVCYRYGIPSVTDGMVQNKTADITLSRDDAPYTKNKLYFVRVRNNIEFFNANAGAVRAIEGIPYEMPLSKYADKVSGYVVDETTYVGTSGGAYVFKGWYDNPGFEGDPVVFDDAHTMPAHGLRLYAKWEAPTFKVTYDPRGGTFTDESGEFQGDEVVILEVGYKAEAPEPNDPVKAGSRFVEWESLDGKPFHFDNPIVCDTTVVAYWSSPAYHVTYDLGEGQGSAPTDSNGYLSGSFAVALEGADFTCADGRHFVGWAGTDGAVYLPGELVPVGDDDVVLTAVYDGPLYTGLIYDLNYKGHGIASPVGYERDTTSVPHVRNNTVVDLRKPTAAETPAGYTFGGWYIDADFSGSALSKVMVDARAAANGLAAASANEVDAVLSPQSATGADDAITSQAATAEANVVYAKWIKDPAQGNPQQDDDADVRQDDPQPDNDADDKRGEVKGPKAAKMSVPRTGDDTPLAPLALTAAASLAIALFSARRADARQPGQPRFTRPK